MLASRLFWKIFAAYTVLTLVSAVCFVVIISERQRSILLDQVERRLHDTAVVLGSRMAAEFQSGFSPQLQEEIRRLGRENHTRLTLVADDGTVIADSDEDPAVMENHRDREELQQARREGVGIAHRPSPTLGIPMMYYALRLGNSELPVGFVRVAMKTAAVDSRILSVQQRIWVTAILLSLAALTLTYFVVGRIIRPLETLTEAAQAMAGGDFQQRVVVKNQDELGTLAEAFNLMGRELGARIHELQQKGRQLEANSQRLATVLGGMVEGVVAVDDQERILFANQTAHALLDFTGPNIVGRPIWEAVRNPTFQEVVREALGSRHAPRAVREQTGGLSGNRYASSAADGTRSVPATLAADGTRSASATMGGQRPLEFQIPRTDSVVSLLASRLPGDPCPGVVLVLHDVTELRRLENMRREFVSNVSHELKTPLSAIQAYTETLLSGAIDDPEHNRQFLHRIEEQAERLHALILDLLRLARIESGQDVFEMAAINIADVIHTCVSEHAALAESKSVALVTEPPPDEIRVQADREGLRTILDNLVDNAIKYTPAGGRVTVRSLRRNGAAVIQVEDTGVGIAEKHRARIFERFYRVDRARSRDVGGTGLGLSIVKHLTQVFGGTVEVSSQLGKGSTFSVRLPLAEQ